MKSWILLKHYGETKKATPKLVSGFTLIELLVVIAVIGLLSAIVVASVSKVRQNAMITKANAEINQFIRLAVTAQGESGKTLLNITGNGWSCGVCNSSGDIRNISSGSLCYTQWVSALNTIQTATNNLLSGIDRMYRDPWGSPYCFDENEHEFGPDDCRNDDIRSAGPDGLTYNADDIAYIISWSNHCP